MKKLKATRRLRSQKGMTLIEIILVVTIIAFLFTVVGRGVNSARKKARISQTRIIIGEVGKALDMYSNDCGSYPQNLQGLVQKSDSCANWGPEPYMKKPPQDPWNNELSYESDGQKFTIKSAGPDRQSGTEDDISSEDQ